MATSRSKPKAKKTDSKTQKKTSGKKGGKKTSKVSRKKLESYTNQILNLLESNEDYQSLKPEQICFAVWAAQPESERGTQYDFAKTVDVSPQTLCNWRHIPEIMSLRFDVMQNVLKEKTVDVLDNLTSRATNKDPEFNAAPYINTFLKFIENWNEGVDVNMPDIEVRFGLPPSQFIKPEDDQKAKTSLSQMKGKEVGAILGKKAYKNKRMKSAAVTVSQAKK